MQTVAEREMHCSFSGAYVYCEKVATVFEIFLLLFDTFSGA